MKRKVVLAFLLTGALVLSGCSKTNNSNETSSGSTSTDSSAQGIDVSNMFSDRDKEIGYDEENSTVIKLSDDSTTCDSDAVQISGNTVTIIDEGTYILSGTLTDGMVIVDAEDTDKVQLVLDGVDITSAESAAIYVREADKVFITTASDSQNTLTNGGTYTAIDDNNIDAAIFSKSDLTLNGAGSLTITAKAGHGVVSKDDLVLTMDYPEKTVSASPAEVIQLYPEKMEFMRKMQMTPALDLSIWQTERLISHLTGMESAQETGFRQMVVSTRSKQEAAVKMSRKVTENGSLDLDSRQRVPIRQRKTLSA